MAIAIGLILHETQMFMDWLGVRLQQYLHPVLNSGLRYLF